MPTIPELLRDHVLLDIECVDRVYLNGYVPTLQTGGALVYFLRYHRGQRIPSPAVLGEISCGFADAVEAFAQAHQIPILRFQKGQRKDDIAAQYRRKFTASEGVVFIGVAKEQLSGFKAHKDVKGKRVWFQYSRQRCLSGCTIFTFKMPSSGLALSRLGRMRPIPPKCV